ncbi:MAG TPA: D-cysteine desulfhydrase family protein [Candidatus Dormibacteraeota bacterium]|nr:D-cysteine desulfhydrase family protein [Candidatus Dormibacteraeota bacterium]
MPTPLIALDRLGAALHMPPGRLFAKLDDATGLAAGGNKVRKLEYLGAEACAQGCDTLVTGGGAQSNHARLTAAAARRLGLECTLVLGGQPPEMPVGNLVLDHLLGAELRWVEAYEYRAVEDAIAAAAADLAARGRRPYRIPIGGSTPLGALGYVRCAVELLAQAPRAELVVVATGSGGTQAGLAAGLGEHRRVLGIDVGARPGLAEHVQDLATRTAALAELPPPVGATQIDSSQIGAGYAAPTEACREAITMAARLEGLVLDPVYTGKAMAGLIAARRSGHIGPETRVVFVHTGGLPALFTPAASAWLTSA